MKPWCHKPLRFMGCLSSRNRLSHWTLRPPTAVELDYALGSTHNTGKVCITGSQSWRPLEDSVLLLWVQLGHWRFVKAPQELWCETATENVWSIWWGRSRLRTYHERLVTSSVSPHLTFQWFQTYKDIGKAPWQGLLQLPPPNSFPCIHFFCSLVYTALLFTEISLLTGLEFFEARKHIYLISSLYS